MAKKKYQLVFQFPEDFFVSLSAFNTFGKKLRIALPKHHELNGYDMTSGTINFFVYTDSPSAAFKNFRKHLGGPKIQKHLRAAYREVNGQTFTNLWPENDVRDFHYFYPPRKTIE
ncbi:MAG: hypothetical protein ACRCYY_00150 [Trueperaceae bacterium]